MGKYRKKLKFFSLNSMKQKILYFELVNVRVESIDISEEYEVRRLLRVVDVKYHFP